MSERFGEIGARSGRGFLDGVQQAEKLSLAGRGRHVVGDVFVEDDQPGGVALHVGHIAKGSRHEARVIELRNRVGAESHGSRGVEQNEQLAIGLSAVFLQKAFIGAGEDVPIDVAQVVALAVRAVFGKLLGEPEIGRPVQSRDEAVDHGLGDQVEARYRGEGRGI